MNNDIKPASVDSPEFRELLNHLLGREVWLRDNVDALIAHINAWSDERVNTALNQLAATPVAGWVSVEKDALIDRLAKCLVYNKPSLPDHACAECVPHSDMLVAGFRCAYHEAVAIHALKAAPVATPTQQQEPK